MKNITTEMTDNMKPNDDVLMVNQNKPTSKLITPSTDSFKDVITRSFKDTIIYLKNKWDSDPTKYSSTPLGTYNDKMSPQEFFPLVIKSTELKNLEGYGDAGTFHLISNSPNNREPSTSGELFEIRNMYAFAIIVGIADSNLFPLSLLDNSDGVEDKITHLILKDRGNIVSILKRADEEILNVNQWWRIIAKIENNPFNEFKLINKRFDQVIKKAKKVLQTSTTPQSKITTRHSLKTMVGVDAWNEWFNCDHSMNLRIKYETLGVHTDEMKGLNNSETNWIEYNFLISTLSVGSYYDPDKIDMGEMLKIHAECLNEDIFLGKNDFFLTAVKHKKQEGFESWFPIDYTALESMEWKAMIGDLVRSKTHATTTKVSAWNNLFSRTDSNNKFTVAKKVINNINLMKAISVLPEVEAFENELKSYMKKYPAQNRTQIKDLSLQKHYNVAILLRAVKEQVRKLYTGRNEIGKHTYVAQHILNKMTQSVSDGELILFEKTKLPSGKPIPTAAYPRYKEWFKKIFKKADEELNVLDRAGTSPFDNDYWWEKLKRKLSDGLIYPNSATGILLVYDKKEDGQFIKHEIDFKHKTGLEECHMDPKKMKTSDNMFLGLPHDNYDNGNTPINNLRKYISKFQINMDGWLKQTPNMNGGIVQATRVITDSIAEIWDELGNK
jgi:hypothetical protein